MITKRLIRGNPLSFFLGLFSLCKKQNVPESSLNVFIPDSSWRLWENTRKNNRTYQPADILIPSTHKPGVLPFQWPAAILDQLIDVPARHAVRPTTEKSLITRKNKINTDKTQKKGGLWWSDDVNLKESRVKETQEKVIHENAFTWSDAFLAFVSRQLGLGCPARFDQSKWFQVASVFSPRR